MSDKKTIVGSCGEISEKNGWTTFHIDVGSQYPIRLATKLEKLIGAGREAGGEQTTWTYTEQESEKINEHTGKPYVNRYLDGVGGPTPTEATAPDPAQHRTPLHGADKDRAITRMSCLKSAAVTFSGADFKVGEEKDLATLVIGAATRYETWVMRDIEDLPF